jgi:hypothetical protein
MFSGEMTILQVAENLFGVWRLAFGVWRLAFGVWQTETLASR